MSEFGKKKKNKNGGRGRTAAVKFTEEATEEEHGAEGEKRRGREEKGQGLEFEILKLWQKSISITDRKTVTNEE